MTCATSLITSYPTHFLRAVSTILTTFFHTILPFTTAAIIILALLVRFASICFAGAEMLGYNLGYESESRSGVKGEDASHVLKGLDERTRLRFEVQVEQHRPSAFRWDYG